MGDFGPLTCCSQTAGHHGDEHPRRPLQHPHTGVVEDGAQTTAVRWVMSPAESLLKQAMTSRPST
jgi:hypothetical protein